MGLITEDSIRRVREANDIVAVVESYNIPLRQAGVNLRALCPFHNEKTPSFNVHPRDQYFKCFGCGEGGDVFRFVRLMEHATYPEAVELLAQRAGVKIERAGRTASAREEESETRQALRWANRVALEYFEARLQDEREGGRARAYLSGRGFTQETVADWRLGWSPDSWSGLLEYLVKEAGEHKREKAIEVALAAGVLRRNEKGNVYDAFRGRVMFPIMDSQHRPVGFGGRVLEEKPEAGGKYINSSEGKLFQKRNLLFGLNFASKEVGLKKAVIIVEGYTDTIMCHQYGILHVVATLGTSLTRDHVRLLRRYIQPEGNVLALFDADEAGEKASERACDLFNEEDLPLCLVRNLELKDACEYLPRFGAEAFRAELEKAEEAFHYKLRRTLGAATGQNLSARAAAVKKLMEFVNASPSRIKRAMMRRQVAAEAVVPEDSLPRPEPSRRSRPGGSGAPARRGLGAVETLSRVMQEPQAGRWRWERQLLHYMREKEEWRRRVMAGLPADGFADPACGELSNLINTAWEQGRRPEIAQLMRQIVTESAGKVIAEMSADEGLELSAGELDKILFRLRGEELKLEERELNKELQQGGLAAAREDEILARLIEVGRELRPSLSPADSVPATKTGGASDA